MTQEEITLDTVKKRAVRGVLTLSGRTAIFQAISLISYSILWVLLTAEQMGVFALVIAIKGFFGNFADVGLAASLIQKKEAPREEELKTAFTIQQILVISIVVIIFLLTPLFKSLYGLSQNAVYLLWAVSFSLVLSSLKTIPSTLLERELKFEKFVMPQIVEILLLNLVAVFLAWKGFGITSFTIAMLVSTTAGLVLTYIIRPWRPGFAFSKEVLRPLLRFGLPYQTNTLLAVIKDYGVIIALGGIIGPAGVGFIDWAKKWSEAPLRFFMDQVKTVTFPAFARMQGNKEELSRAVSRSIFYICLLVFPALVFLVILAGPLTDIIPKYDRLKPALFALFLLSFNAGWAAVTTPLTNMLTAVGKINLTLKLMVMWTVLTWIFVPILAWKFHVNGAALGFTIVGLSSIVAIWLANRYVRIDFWKSVGVPFAGSLFMAVIIFILGNIVALSIFGIVFILVVGLICYILALYITLGERIISDLKGAYAALRKD